MAPNLCDAAAMIIARAKTVRLLAHPRDLLQRLLHSGYMQRNGAPEQSLVTPP